MRAQGALSRGTARHGDWQSSNPAVLRPDAQSPRGKALLPLPRWTLLPDPSAATARDRQTQIANGIATRGQALSSRIARGFPPSGDGLPKHLARLSRGTGFTRGQAIRQSSIPALRRPRDHRPGDRLFHCSRRTLVPDPLAVSVCTRETAIRGQTVSRSFLRNGVQESGLKFGVKFAQAKEGEGTGRSIAEAGAQPTDEFHAVLSAT